MATGQLLSDLAVRHLLYTCEQKQISSENLEYHYAETEAIWIVGKRAAVIL